MEKSPRTILFEKLEVFTRAVKWESEGILGGVGVGVSKNAPTPTPTSI
jgi:hypothetical protein